MWREHTELTGGKPKRAKPGGMWQTTLSASSEDEVTYRLVGIAMFATVFAAGDGVPAAKVIQISGDWVSGQSAPVRLFSPVGAGESLHCQSAQGSLTLFLQDGTRQHLDCSHPGKVNAPAPQPGAATQFVAMVRSLFAEKQALPPGTAAVRGDGQGPCEAVLGQDASGRVDVRPAMAGLDSGVYQLDFEAFGKTSETEPVRWNTESTKLPSLPGLKPGLYQFDLLSEDGFEAGRPAVVLLVPAERLEEASSLFRTATDLAPDPKSVADRNLRALALTAIAQQLGIAR